MKNPKPPKKPKDPATPTRAKASREQMPAMSSEHQDLLNPALRRGDAGIGSGTGLQPPPTNSKDRRAEAALAHKARASTQQGFGEAPQTGYVAKSPVKDGTPEINAKLAQVLGYRLGEDEDGDE